MGEIYESGVVVPETGIYRVVHSAHRLSHEAVILKGHRFPKCQKCYEAVFFELIHAAPDLFRHATYILYELPVIEESTEASTA